MRAWPVVRPDDVGQCSDLKASRISSERSSGGDGADILDGGFDGYDLCNLGPGGMTRIACER